MAASGGSSKAKATPVPGPSVASQNNRASNSGASVQVLIKASPSVAPSEDESTIKVLPKKDNKEKSSSGSGGTIKLKKPVPKHNKPGNWRDGSVVEDEKKKRPETPSTTNNSLPASPGPVVNQLDDNAREAFATGRPLEDGVDSRVCKHCKKSILKTAVKAHVNACLKAKKEKAQRKKEQKEAREKERRALENEDKDEDGDANIGEDDEEKGAGIKTAKKSAGKKVEIEKGKKRKAEGDAEKGPKTKKKKEEVKVKATKPKVQGQLSNFKPLIFHTTMTVVTGTHEGPVVIDLTADSDDEGPVDVEKQCGVLKDGVPCARSLTCKSHSMGAKRAVPGRSLPYDMLLTAYQKKNQAKQQKAAIDANAPLEDEEAANGPVDSDEELTAVMHGLSNWNPQPVVPPLIQIPIERTYQKQRLYEQLHNATNGFTVNIFKVVGYGAQRLPPGHPGYTGNGQIGDGDAEGEPETPIGLNAGMVAADRRSSNFNLTMPQAKRNSVTVVPR